MNFDPLDEPLENFKPRENTTQYNDVTGKCRDWVEGSTAIIRGYFKIHDLSLMAVTVARGRTYTNKIWNNPRVVDGWAGVEGQECQRTQSSWEESVIAENLQIRGKGGIWYTLTSGYQLLR